LKVYWLNKDYGVTVRTPEHWSVDEPERLLFVILPSWRKNFSKKIQYV